MSQNIVDKLLVIMYNTVEKVRKEEFAKDQKLYCDYTLHHCPLVQKSSINKAISEKDEKNEIKKTYKIF